MQITKNKLKKIINEEVETVLNEDWASRNLPAWLGGDSGESLVNQGANMARRFTSPEGVYSLIPDVIKQGEDVQHWPDPQFDPNKPAPTPEYVDASGHEPTGQYMSMPADDYKTYVDEKARQDAGKSVEHALQPLGIVPGVPQRPGRGLPQTAGPILPPYEKVVPESLHRIIQEEFAKMLA